MSFLFLIRMQGTDITPPMVKGSSASSFQTLKKKVKPLVNMFILPKQLTQFNVSLHVISLTDLLMNRQIVNTIQLMNKLVQPV